MDYWNKIKLLNRKKTDPHTFIFTGEPSPEAPQMHRFYYREGWCREVEPASLEELDNLQAEQGINWLNVYGLSDVALIAGICQQQGIDNLVIQDILDINQRPKFQAYENYHFLTIKTTVPAAEEMTIEQISFVFNRHYLISFQEKKADYFDHIRYRLREKKGVIRSRRPDFLLYTMLEAILDNYFKSLERINLDIEKLNQQSIQSNASPEVLEQIEKHRRAVQFIKNAIQPIREFTLTIERKLVPFIEKENFKFFQEIKDLCLTLLDDCVTLFTLLDSSTNLFFSVQGHRMNQVMKTLTIVATIFIPLTFLAGIYGMNFRYMPELEWRYGYAMLWLAVVLIFLLMLVYFKRKKWL